mmetsp:Transcript_23192/g.64703  ORF Transcript_23192/g.64703 Transcript_23192/m.64703 type:complete len:332 (+) Transcript_23192:406-1401(+)
MSSHRSNILRPPVVRIPDIHVHLDTWRVDQISHHLETPVPAQNMQRRVTINVDDVDICVAFFHQHFDDNGKDVVDSREYLARDEQRSLVSPIGQVGSDLPCVHQDVEYLSVASIVLITIALDGEMQRGVAPTILDIDIDTFNFSHILYNIKVPTRARKVQRCVSQGVPDIDVSVWKLEEAFHHVKVPTSCCDLQQRACVTVPSINVKVGLCDEIFDHMKPFISAGKEQRCVALLVLSIDISICLFNQMFHHLNASAHARKVQRGLARAIRVVRAHICLPNKKFHHLEIPLHACKVQWSLTSTVGDVSTSLPFLHKVPDSINTRIFGRAHEV